MNPTLILVATIWNSIVAWAVIGLVHLMIGFASGNWDWKPEYLFLWGAVLVYGYLKLWESEL